jgi:hypothetical protein
MKPMRFVEHQRLEFGQVQRAAVEMVDHPPRGADDDMHATLERLQLRVVALAAVDRQHVEALDLVGVALEGLGDLDGQLAGRRQHQYLRLARGQVEARQQGQRERGGLAGTGLRLPEHVATGQQRRDGGGLDRRRGFVADLGHRCHHGLGKAQIGEAQGGDFGRHGRLGTAEWTGYCGRRGSICRSKPDARPCAAPAADGRPIVANPWKSIDCGISTRPSWAAGRPRRGNGR